MADQLKIVELTHGCIVRDPDGRTWIWDDMNTRQIYIDEYGIGPDVPVGLSPSGILMTFANKDIIVDALEEKGGATDDQAI